MKTEESYFKNIVEQIEMLQKELVDKKRIAEKMVESKLEQVKEQGWHTEIPNLVGKNFYGVEIVVTKVEDFGKFVKAEFYVTKGELKGYTLKYRVTKANMYTLKFSFRVGEIVKLHLVKLKAVEFEKKTRFGVATYKPKVFITKNVFVRKPGRRSK